MSVINTANSLYRGVDDGADHPGRLTFGVEIEFLCPVVPEGSYDHHAYLDDRRVAHEHRDREEGALVFSALKRTPSITIQVKDIFHDGLTYNTWLFQPDDSVRVDRSDPLGATYKMDACEVSSEVFFAGDQTSKAKVRAVCAAIRSERVLLNDSTAVHVHVGRGSRGFTLLTMKKLTSLLWLLDEPLMWLQHPSRSKSEYCKRITKHSNLARLARNRILPENLSELGLQQMIEHVPKDCRDAHEIEMVRIWGANNIEEIQRLVELRPCGFTIRGSVSYQNLGPGKLNTVEFRQMGGSLEPKVIMTWAEICVEIVDFARLADAPSFRFMMVDMWDLQALPLACAVELIRKLGFSDSVSQYYMAKNGDYYLDGDRTYFEGQERGRFVPPLPDSA